MNRIKKAAPSCGKCLSPYFLCSNIAEHLKEWRVSEAHTECVSTLQEYFSRVEFESLDQELSTRVLVKSSGKL